MTYKDVAQGRKHGREYYYKNRKIILIRRKKHYHKCLDCDKLIVPKAKRCHSCDMKERIRNGFILSSKSRKNLSKRMKKNNPMFNKKIAKMVGSTKKKKYASGENIHPMLGKKRPDTSKMLKENNPMKNPETVEKVRKTLTKLYKEGKMKPICFWKGKTNPSFKKMRNQDWFMEKIIKGLHLKPNKPEKVIIKILKRNNLPFIYTGDGKLIVGGKCPDFVHNKDKKVIEMHGRAFHDPNSSRGKVFKISYHRTEKGTIEHYEKNGYGCLVIWDDELENPNKVLNKIKNF